MRVLAFCERPGFLWGLAEARETRVKQILGPQDNIRQGQDRVRVSSGL